MRRQRRPRMYKIKFSRGTESAQATRCHIISVNYTYIQIITCKWGFDLDSRYLWQADTGLICCLDSKVDNYETNPQKPGITCGNTDSDTQLFVVEYLLLVGAFFPFLFRFKRVVLKCIFSFQHNPVFHFNTAVSPLCRHVWVSLLFPSPCEASQHFHCENNSINGNLGNLIKEKREEKTLVFLFYFLRTPQVRCEKQIRSVRWIGTSSICSVCLCTRTNHRGA